MGIFSQFFKKKPEAGQSEIPSDMTVANLTVSGIAGTRREPHARERIEGGVDLRQLSSGAVVEARTKNSIYTVQLGEGGQLMLTGHAEHCPVPTEVVSVGSVLLTGAVCDGYLAPGMRMEFRVGARRVFTSRLLSVVIVNPGGA